MGIDDMALQAEIKALSQNVERLTTATEKLSEKVSRIGILEEQNRNHSEAIQRSFIASDKVKDELMETEKTLTEGIRALITANDVEHKIYNRWIWLVTGFVVALTVMWSMFGVHISRLIEEQNKMFAAMQAHVYTDKIVDPEQVRAIIKELKNEPH